MTDAPAPAKDAKSQALKIVLGVSLALNLFLVGAAGSWLWRHGPPPPPPGGPMGMETMQMGGWPRFMPDSRRAEARALFEASRDARKARAAAMRGAFNEGLAALRAKPYDEAAFAAALTKLRDETDKLTSGVQGDLVTLVGRMTDAERAAFAERLERRPSRHREREDD